MNTLDFSNFKISAVSGVISKLKLPVGLSPLGALAQLPGTWRGTGFNQIWRPFHGSQDRFLELNETSEELQFVEIPGEIPNRGLLQQDINLHGLTYLQKVSDVNVKQNGQPTGIHIEPGIWITVPSTTNPQDPTTVARLANIPHGTSLTAQGTALTVSGPPTIAPASISPFLIAPPHSPIAFPETNLGVPSAFRTPASDIPHVTQAMVNNPNIVLSNAIAGQTIKSTTVLRVSTKDLNPPTSGGGTSNIAFLDGVGGTPNASAVQMDAIFWIEEVDLGHGKTKLQLQYSQTVFLNFNGLSWPHVSVATLEKVPHLVIPPIGPKHIGPKIPKVK
ncbi:MAG TPA: heme-binding protein [Terracidiphilus sp.]|nr:heme-binding protein [Terracidiphilus sp.]